MATATLAWGVNLPARLVIVKGTEFFDGKSSRYVDYPITDILQMIGRAGRPGFDTEGRAVVMVETSKKNFYKVNPLLNKKLEDSLSLKPFLMQKPLYAEGSSYFTILERFIKMTTAIIVTIV